MPHLGQVTRENFGQRLAGLMAGVEPGAHKLSSSTVTQHGGNADTISLGSASDWLFWQMVGASADTLTGNPGQSNFI
jgi:hypothetical protein